jgi:CelD/BcsL family acetyltransferase involved in cellulose biosynthesis
MHCLSKSEALELINKRLDLFNQAETTNPFAGAAWTRHFIEQIAEASWLFTIPEHQNGGDSLMLLYSEPAKPYRRCAVANYYTSLYSPLISTLTSPPQRAAAITALVAQLTKGKPSCSAIHLAPLANDCADSQALHQAFSSCGWYVKQYDCFGNWYLPCANLSFADYMAGRSSQLVNTITRKQKKFTRTDGARLEIISDPNDVAAAMAAYDSIYAKSWKKPEPYKTFVRDWAVICAKNGWLRLGLAWLNDQPIAAQFWFTLHQRAFIFKLAYDEAYTKLSAGTVLSAHLFQFALDHDHVQEIDYLTGDDLYKQMWMTHRRQRVGLIAFNPLTFRGLFGMLWEHASTLQKRIRTYFSTSVST